LAVNIFIGATQIKANLCYTAQGRDFFAIDSTPTIDKCQIDDTLKEMVFKNVVILLL